MASKSPKTEAKTTAEPKISEGILSILVRLERFGWDILGVFLLALAAVTILGLLIPEWTSGVLTNVWLEFLFAWFGWGIVWIVTAIGIAGLWMLRRRQALDTPPVPWGRVLALELAAFASMVILALGNGLEPPLDADVLAGGRVGWALGEITHRLLIEIGFSNLAWSALIWMGVFFLGLVLGLGLVGPVAAWARRTRQAAEVQEPPPSVFVSPPESVPESIEVQEKTIVEDPNRKKRTFIPAEFRKRFTFASKEDKKPVKAPPRDERLPPIELLGDEKAIRPDERHINQTAGLIEKTLAEFGIPAKVIDFQVGPTVTQFAIVPGFVEKPGEDNPQKVRVSQITALQRDLALALSAQRLRIQAPVPGRPFVGIEVPNSRSAQVRLRSILESQAFHKVGSPLAIALGRDVSGQPVVADLGSMPHLLIAGTTGSGKSVCIAALTVCLVMNNPPEDLRLVMVDPKMVELVRFNGLPHLFGKVETDVERILGVLRWTVAEMDRRYKLLEESRSRNIDSYNRKMRKKSGGEVLPRIVVLIDELADLMMSAPDQTEHNLVRLAQMARATGIHLIVATQRPSTDVVTGLIKANFPARISFAVASSIDSRVILDGNGAESLLGRGDMLFLPPDAAAPIRAQGVIVNDQEIERVISTWQKSVAQAEAVAEQNAPWEDLLEEEALNEDYDDLVIQAMKVVQETQRASASMLQRRLRIGYPRAARLIDELEVMGVVGPAQGAGKEREVWLGPNDELPLNKPDLDLE